MLGRRTDGVRKGYSGRKVPIDLLLNYWEESDLTAVQIANKLQFSVDVILRKLIEARELADPRVLKGDARRAKG